MDRMREAVCFAMSIAASISVIGFERCFLETCRRSRKRETGPGKFDPGSAGRG
jgi:hypothetical protein